MSRRTKAEREDDLRLISKLYTQNQSVRGIADHINSIRKYNITFKTIANDINFLRKEWQKEQNGFISMHVTVELNKSIERERLLWEAWDHSLLHGTKNKILQVVSDQSGQYQVERISSEGLGHWRFMELMRKEAEFRCKLLGSFAATSINSNYSSVEAGEFIKIVESVN